MEKKKLVIDDKKMTYDDIVNVRKDVSEFEYRRSNVSIVKFVCISLIVLAIIFGSLLLFHII